jgi:hypothetical protein
MPIDITRSQNANLGFLDSVAQDINRLDLSGIDKVLFEYAEKYKNELVVSIKRNRVSASGDMEQNIRYDLIEESDGSKSLNIYFVDYAKFVDKGVKGWRSSKNAPNSPYQYKTKGMNAEGRESIKNYILSGKAKVRVKDVKKYGAVGGEKKGVSLLDAKVNTLIYLIKKYGIKTTNFIKEPTDRVFKDLPIAISEEIGQQIAIQITR